uniref:Homeobox domain-containing protein n=1 Tax=Parastrongyloides trichosuri TaxID=131310 RepID=A0A0N4ZSX9_PARTI
MNLTKSNKSNNEHELSPFLDSIFNNFHDDDDDKKENIENGSTKTLSPNRGIFKGKDHKLLEEFFSKNKYPNMKEKLDLAENLKSSPMKIQTWFQNRRAKTRKRNNLPNKNDVLSPSKKSRISQIVESVIAREMKNVSNPSSPNENNLDNEMGNTKMGNFDGLSSLFNNMDKENKCQTDVFQGNNAAFVCGLWYGLNLFFGNASPETINQFMSGNK